MAAQTITPAPLQGAFSIALPELNNDGYADLVVASDRAASGTHFYVMLNDHAGIFAAPVAYSDLYAVTTTARSVASADLNGDGYSDLADGASIALGNGYGAFTSPIALGFAATINVKDQAVGDLNNDGYSDLIIGTVDSNAVAAQYTVLLGNGDGTFATSTSFTTGGTGIDTIALGDLTQDGKPDLVVYDSTGTVRVWLNTTP